MGSRYCSAQHDPQRAWELMEEDVGANLKAKLQPRRPGENLKVAQTVLKRRDRNLQAAAKRAEQIAKAKAKAKQTKYKGGFKVIKMETLLKQSLDKIKEEKRLKRLPNKKKPKPKKKEQVIALCRNGKKGVPKKVKSVLRDFGLRARHSMTFILNNEESARKLQEVKPFTFWGVPSFKNVYNLVHKKAVFVDKEAAVKKVVLSDNMLIEKHLGDLGVICTEDLAHVIHTGGKGFDEVMRRLAPVNMGDSKKVEGLVEKKHHDCGDLRGRINKVLEALMGE